ncbi:MAG: hypothetical protein CVT63_01220 [Candidatus Anoxymicrobium japonicum]|uniref:Uncharacterized protein n=1 Tax=Candidatus Anoxymicrobium japonicum TaxID=2013648 RepID=A0A2N3G7Q4_9ACTN|nr:MAG: hypothetical protein CVT63_01220 [Candidatus Anoxymicrobium japonicum]
MKRIRILYMDAAKDRVFQKALARHGEISFARDVNGAVALMADGDFEYYFIDADVPQSQAFLEHLNHDPQLLPPRGVVLLTENDEEDCEAWGVDTFLTRSTATDDLPYIFSHLKGDQCESATVLKLASFNPVESEPEQKKGAPVTASVEASCNVDGGDARELLKARREADPVDDRFVATPNRFSGAASQSRPARVALAALLVLVLGAWLFTQGPLKSGSAGPKSRAADSKRVNAEAAPKNEFGALKGYAPSAGATAPVTTPAPAGEQPQTAAAQTENVNAAVAPTPTPTPTPPIAPAPEPVANRAPYASISGPGTVQRNAPASYSVSCGDPDGDSVTASWTSQTFTWGSPGGKSITVTVTDSHGASHIASMSVTVI